jgi:hypothetical protein
MASSSLTLLFATIAIALRWPSNAWVLIRWLPVSCGALRSIEIGLRNVSLRVPITSIDAFVARRVAETVQDDKLEQ